MTIVAFVADLMDRSRVSAALDDLTFARDPAVAAGAEVVIVDLARFADAVAPIRALAPDARIVAFGPHVDDELLAGAADAGADVVMARSQFFRDPRGAVTGK